MQNSSNPSGNIYSSGPRGVVSANSPYARTMPKNASSTKSYVPSALASVGSLDDLTSGPSPEVTSTPSPRSKSRQILPGENLPEHHFKKRYFAENQAPPPIVATPTSSKNGSPPLSSSPSWKIKIILDQTRQLTLEKKIKSRKEICSNLGYFVKLWWVKQNVSLLEWVGTWDWKIFSTFCLLIFVFFCIDTNLVICSY